jgi:hypothetical protein
LTQMNADGIRQAQVPNADLHGYIVHPVPGDSSRGKMAGSVFSES